MMHKKWPKYKAPSRTIYRQVADDFGSIDGYPTVVSQRLFMKTWNIAKAYYSQSQ